MFITYQRVYFGRDYFLSIRLLVQNGVGSGANTRKRFDMNSRAMHKLRDDPAHVG